MKILSMNATFGKLNAATLQFNPQLNIVHAPNEWGKSTWCAFIEAMLYGIDTSSRSKTGFLADKEHYAPWSGAPMSGRMDILWNGKKITIERKNKGRTPFGDISVYETETGLALPELAVNHIGQLLLGVERSVFTRAGFLKQSQMPVTEDETLRRRLNELVTTGDESGQSEQLSQKLRDLKNRCRFNKKGLLPELETRLSDVENKLSQLDDLQTQIAAIEIRQKELAEENRLLENHLAALSYQENLARTQKLAAAQVAVDTAKAEWETACKACEKLPSETQIRENLIALRKLRDQREALSLETLSPLPDAPYSSPLFRGKDPQAVVSETRADAQTVTQLKSKRQTKSYVFAGLLLLLGILGLTLYPELVRKAVGGIFALCGLGLLIAGIVKSQHLQKMIASITEKYPGLPLERWLPEAEAYAAALSAYHADKANRQAALEDFERRKAENEAAFKQLTGTLTPGQFEQFCDDAQNQYRAMGDAEQKYQQAQSLLQAMADHQKEVAVPTFPDKMTLSHTDTKQKLSVNQAEAQSLRHKLGICQGQMETLGQAQALQAQKAAMELRHGKLEMHHRALQFAMETLENASRELQRRYAPRISQRAQEIFSRLTGGRYQRLALCQDLSLETAAEGETTLHGSLWRSDGTVDQLYLALRLAVAEELTPTAPLILDDALVRFDDTRLISAMEILKEESQAKQVIVFTCQSREEGAIQ